MDKKQRIESKGNKEMGKDVRSSANRNEVSLGSLSGSEDEPVAER